MDEFVVYILHSTKLGRYYIGETKNLQQRISYHLSKEFPTAYTTKANDWELFLVIRCSSRAQARKIEAHIKKMKSKKYIGNLKKHPQITEKLLVKYADQDI